MKTPPNTIANWEEVFFQDILKATKMNLRVNESEYCYEYRDENIDRSRYTCIVNRKLNEKDEKFNISTTSYISKSTFADIVNGFSN